MEAHRNAEAQALTVRTMLLDDREYQVDVRRKVSLAPEAPRIVVVSYQGNAAARELLRVCIAGVQRFTPEPHELWIVDNNSPEEHLDWLIEWPGINLALNRTEPLPREELDRSHAETGQHGQKNWGSYANAVGLELGLKAIDPETSFLVTMHMDALPCSEGWLSFLQSKITGRIAASGVRIDRTRTPEGVLHVLGYMVDFQIFRGLGLDFFPDLPHLDVGDRVTIRLREAGYEVFACPNTVWEPELAETIPPSSPLRHLHVDRAFNDNGEVIFLHLGRGVRRSIGEHRKGIGAEEWARFVDEHLLAGA
ncbi:MAG: hypothetical protein HY914_03940 [Desulfomonile tiedjei]|nr:hypothetical protein [Desulfomonile tiedjei]